MEFHIKKSRFREKSRFKESECADGGHSLNRDFTVHLSQCIAAEWLRMFSSCSFFLSFFEGGDFNAGFFRWQQMQYKVGVFFTQKPRERKKSFLLRFKKRPKKSVLQSKIFPNVIFLPLGAKSSLTPNTLMSMNASCWWSLNMCMKFVTVLSALQATFLNLQTCTIFNQIYPSTVDSGYNIHGYKRQPVIVAT